MASLVQSLSNFRKFIVSRFPWRGFLILILIVLLSIWMFFAPEGILGKADAIGYAVCHRIGHRSFHIGETQFSVCARCAGQYLGAVLGMLFLGIFRRRRIVRDRGIKGRSLVLHPAGLPAAYNTGSGGSPVARDAPTSHPAHRSTIHYFVSRCIQWQNSSRLWVLHK